MVLEYFLKLKNSKTNIFLNISSDFERAIQILASCFVTQAFLCRETGQASDIGDPWWPILPPAVTKLLPASQIFKLLANCIRETHHRLKIT